AGSTADKEATWVCSTSCSDAGRKPQAISRATRRSAAKACTKSRRAPRRIAPPRTRLRRRKSARPPPSTTRSARRRSGPAGPADVDRRLAGLAETVDRRLGQLDVKVDRRLETAQQTSAAIHERLGKVDSAATQMLERAGDLARLEQALRPPKARGGFGELLLENLLRDRLPPTAYEMQYTFDSGERVDALLRVDRSIPIDSKFPLDNYNRLVEAETDDERTLAEPQFGRDVKQHIEAIAAKYIRPDEGTYDFAFMYIPVEAVYYELACGKTGALLAYANERRVFPVSPKI